jgi:HK97 family phage portal protein
VGILRSARAAAHRFLGKESRAARVILSSLSMPGPIPHVRFEQLSKESYERCIAVYACVSAIMNAAATVEWVQYEKARGTANPGKARRTMGQRAAQKAFFKSQAPGRAGLRKALDVTEVDDTPLLRLIEQPNPRQAKSAYIASLAGFKLIAGNAYEEFVSPNRPGAPPMEMYSLRPDRVQIMPGTARGEEGLVGGYRYESGGAADFFPEASVIHHKSFHPTDDWYGLSPIQAAMRVIRTDNKASDWNYALLDNQARPSGALISPTSVTDETYERLKREILEGFGGNPGLPLFLEGGLKWEQFGLSPLEIDWLDAKKMNRVEISSIFSVPPEIAGDSEHKTYNSMPEARKAFWMEAVMPFLDEVRDMWNMRLVPRFGERTFVDYDRDQIDALQEDQRYLWDRVGRADWITINEARNATGYDDSAEPDTDTPRKLLPNQAAGAAAPGATSQADTIKAIEDVLELKDQELSPSQKKALKQLRQLMADHFDAQGAAIAARLVARLQS